MKRWLRILCLAIALLAFAATAQAQAFTVGICQFSQHDSLDAATQGFKDALTDRFGGQIAFIELNANGDFSACTAVVNRLVAEDVDLILANSTNALQAAATATGQIPILGTAVTDYAAALQLDGFDGTIGGNISGTSDFIPPDGPAALIEELFPGAQTIGMVYCSSESNSLYQIRAVQAELEARGYACKRCAFIDSTDLSSVTTAAAADCDALYIPTDNTVAANAELIANICIPGQVPVITGDESTCKVCGVATVSVDYHALGYATGEMAARILAEGADISAMPVEYAPSFSKKYNAAICEALNIGAPAGYVPLEAE